MISIENKNVFASVLTAFVRLSKIYGTHQRTIKIMLKLKNFQIARAIIVISLFAIFSSACSSLNQNNSSVSQTNVNISQPQRRPTRDPNAVKYFESVEEIAKIKAAFAEKIGGEVKILEMNLAENYSEIQAQDPRKPENVDQYTYRDGAMEKVVPVKISGSGKLEDNLFNINDVATEKIPDLVREAMERSKDLEDPKPSLVRLELDHKGKPEINVSISSTRKNALMVCDAKGNVIRYQRY